MTISNLIVRCLRKNLVLSVWVSEMPFQKIMSRKFLPLSRTLFYSLPPSSTFPNFAVTIKTDYGNLLNRSPFRLGFFQKTLFSPVHYFCWNSYPLSVPVSLVSYHLHKSPLYPASIARRMFSPCSTAQIKLFPASLLFVMVRAQFCFRSVVLDAHPAPLLTFLVPLTAYPNLESSC